VDVRGTVLLTATAASVLVPLVEGRALDWPYRVREARNGSAQRA
jgi:hypothetical protein